MAELNEHDFLSLDSEHFATADDDDSSPFSTLWTEFARSHPRLSPPPSPTRHSVHNATSSESPAVVSRSNVELRALEYVSEYDSNLMCPICHVPFIEPIVLDCDHTFCGDCFEEYRVGGSGTERSKCPSCRSFHLGGSRKASRLIRNMCNDIQVRCPNTGCQSVMARGCIELHATKDCPEQELSCPDLNCSRSTKRKHFLTDQCVHTSSFECDCGATIPLGRMNWARHKDEDCPSIPPSLDTLHSHGNDPSAPDNQHQCPGAPFGCDAAITSHESLTTHTTICIFARLGPTLKRQATHLQTLQDQLTMTKLRNEVLETSLDRLSTLITTTIQPRLESLSHDQDPDPDIEEIPRDLSVLPAHLTPSPTATANINQHYADTLQNDIYPRLTHIESSLDSITAHLSELDARSTMALMNETLRIREELAHINGVMYSTRAQIQWLLNRERIVGQREAMGAGGAGMNGGGSGGARGRVGAPSASGNAGSAGPAENGANVSESHGGGGCTSTVAGLQTQRPPMDRNMSSAWSTSQAGVGSGYGPRSGQTSVATSPLFGAARLSGRRASGGSSQERVKL